MNCTILFMPRNIFTSTKSTIHQNDMSSHLMFFQQRNMFIHTDLLIILRWNVWINCDIWTQCSWSFWNFSVILFFLEANDQIANEQIFCCCSKLTLVSLFSTLFHWNQQIDKNFKFQSKFVRHMFDADISMSFFVLNTWQNKFVWARTLITEILTKNGTNLLRFNCFSVSCIAWNQFDFNVFYT